MYFTALGIESVKPLAFSRGKAKESRTVSAVPDEVIDATLPHCSKVLKAMIELQRWTGMRTGEVCAIKEEYIAMNGDVWTYTVPSEKAKEIARKLMGHSGSHGKRRSQAGHTQRPVSDGNGEADGPQKRSQWVLGWVTP